MAHLQVHNFLDLEALVLLEHEEEEEEDDLSKSHGLVHSVIHIKIFYTGDLFDDDEISSDGLGDVSHVGFASSTAQDSTVQDLEDEARRIVARGAQPDTITEDLALPFRGPRDSDPSVWSVRVKVGVLLSPRTVLTNYGQLGKEDDVVLQ